MKVNKLFIELKSYIISLPIKDHQPCNKTKQEYIKEYMRMHENGTTPELQATRKSSYYKYRAAWIFTNTILSERLILEIEEEDDIDIKMDLINKLNQSVERIKKYPPKNCLDNTVDVPFRKNALQKSLSKKGQIVTLKKSWSTLMFEHMCAAKSKYLDALCVMYVTGCRPAELMQGVKVEDHMNGLKFTISGKKTHGGKYGQDQRSYVVMIDNDSHYHYLKQKMTNDASSYTVKVDSAKLLGEQIRHNSKIVLQHEKTYVSPYSKRLTLPRSPFRQLLFYRFDLFWSQRQQFINAAVWPGR